MGVTTIEKSRLLGLMQKKERGQITAKDAAYSTGRLARNQRLWRRISVVEAGSYSAAGPYKKAAPICRWGQPSKHTVVGSMMHL